MDKSNYNLEEMKKTNPFKVPEGYFEGLSSQIMSTLPQQQKKKTISLWGRVKPWSYAAAVIVATLFAVNLFMGFPFQKNHHDFDLSSAADIDAYFDYYEEQLMEDLYQESLYSEVYSDELDVE